VVAGLIMAAVFLSFVTQSDLIGKMFGAGLGLAILIDVLIVRMEPERLLSLRWHPAAVETSVDYSKEPATLVEFTLKAVEGGTLLILVESGFDQIPPARRLEAFRMNSGGWDIQMKNIEKHVATA